MFNYSKLKGKMKEKGITQEKLSEMIGIDKSTLSLKLNNQALLNQDEINKITKILKIPAKEIKEYFFKEEV